MRQIANPNTGIVRPNQGPLTDQPRYTLITASGAILAPGLWQHRFDIPGDEIIITPVNNLPQLCAIQGPGEEVLIVPFSLDLGACGVPVVDPTGAFVTFPGLMFLTVIPGVVTGIGQYAILLLFNVSGVPSGLPSVVTLPITGVWPGGGPGPVVLPLGAQTGTLNPVLPGDVSVAVVNPVPGTVTITFPGAGPFVQTLPCPDLPGLWGFLFFDDAINQAFSDWEVGPGIIGGVTHRGCIGISTFHPVRARQNFNYFHLMRPAGVGGQQDLLIHVRQGQFSNAVDNIPT